MADDYQRRMLALSEELRAQGVRPSTFAPPFHRLAWRFGYHIRPPFYQSFRTLAINMAVPFGIMFALVNWFDPWTSQERSAIRTLVVSTFAAVFFGVMMAWSVRRQAARLVLPPLEG